ncbi:MAG: peptidoglycan-binding protein [Prevotella sp.]|nr:peptidoglycan-binding protein [Prevotella sp.]
MATIYKLGNKGEGVKQMQRALAAAGYAVTADGDFGPKTEAAVKAYQRAKGLTPVDGIAGPATLSVLLRPEGFTITPAYISTHITRCANRAVKYIAIHYTAGTTSRGGTALATRNVFLQRQASADFVVDNTTIVQINPDPTNYYCWAVGDAKNKWTGGARLYGVATNKNTVSIEVCSTLRQGTSAAVPNHEGWSLSDRAVENARRLVRHLMMLYGVPRQQVVRHYDVSGKLCPGVPGWNDGPLYAPDGKAISGRQSDSRLWQAFWQSL